jgi:molybdenum cofactor synthesis domain-containing protein
MIKVGILTISDRRSKGKLEDKSGGLIQELITQRGEFDVVKRIIIPDEKDKIVQKLMELTDDVKVDLILTTGGTGLGERDVTPEATKEVIEREVPGFVEIMRVESFKITPHALLSRAIAGVRGKSLIINLPGSPKAVSECLDLILPSIPHAIYILKGEVEECARETTS